MTLLIIILVSFIAGVFVGALIVGSKDRPLKTPMAPMVRPPVEDYEIFWYKNENV